MAALQSSVLSCFLVSIILSSVAAFTPITPNLKRHKYIHPHTFVENKGKAIILFSSDQDLLVNETEMSQSKSNDVGKFVEYLGKSTSSFVSLSFFSVLAWKRDAFMFTFFAGTIGNAILSKVLKRILDQSRPEALASEESLREKPTDPGMPSSHAMSLGFIGTFTSLNIPQLWIPIFLYIFVALYYRVKINLHSIEQVLVGIIIGSFNGWGWNYLSHETFISAAQNILGESPLSSIYLLIPAFVGLLVVGSFERRISKFFQNKKES